MRIAIATDIHGNRHGFEAVLAAAAAERVDEVWCLGDLVGYGAEPDACVSLAAQHVDICLAGNHDLGVIGTISLEEFSRGAGLAALWTRDAISDDTRAFLAALPPDRLIGDFALYHASPRDPVWEYVLSGLLAELCLDAQSRRISFIGHSHVALSFHRETTQGEVIGSTRPHGELLDLSSGDWLLNPGSAGQPRDGDPRAAWLLLDTDRLTAEYRREQYDIEGAAAAIRAAGLPDSLADRLQHGQ